MMSHADYLGAHYNAVDKYNITAPEQVSSRAGLLLLVCPIWYTSGYIRDLAFDLHPVSVQREGYSAHDFSGFSWLCSHSKGGKSPK